MFKYDPKEIYEGENRKALKHSSCLTSHILLSGSSKEVFLKTWQHQKKTGKKALLN